jgi:hypothetical protein
MRLWKPDIHRASSARVRKQLLAVLMIGYLVELAPGYTGWRQDENKIGNTRFAGLG